VQCRQCRKSVFSGGCRDSLLMPKGAVASGVGADHWHRLKSTLADYTGYLPTGRSLATSVSLRPVLFK
jgi:hypothetical protein